MDKKGFTLIEILIAVAVIGIGFGIILLTTSNVEQSIINSNSDIKDYFITDNKLKGYILDKAYGVSIDFNDEEKEGMSIDTDEKDTFDDNLGFYSVSLKHKTLTDEDSKVSLKCYVLSHKQ